MIKLKPINLIFLIVFFVSGCQQLDKIIIEDVNNIVESMKIVPEKKVSLLQKDKLDLTKNIQHSNSAEEEIKKYVKPLKEAHLTPIKPAVSISFYQPKIFKPIKPKVKINFTYQEPYYNFNHYTDYYFIPPSIFTIEPFIKLFFVEIIRLIKSIRSSVLPIFSTAIYFFTNSFT